MRNEFIRPVRLGENGEILSATDAAFADAPCVHLRDPESGKPLDRDGENKPMNEFWLRRLRDRDVEEALSPAARAAVPLSAAARAAIAKKPGDPA